MPTKQLFNEFADIPALQAEKAKVKEIFGEIKASIIELSNIGLKLDASKSINEIAKAQQNVIKQQQTIITNENKLAESEARIAKIQAETAVKQEKADLTRTKNLIAQNKELDRQNALQEKANKAGAQGNTSIPGVQNVSQQRANYVQSVPFTTNLGEIEKEQSALEKTGTVVNALEQEEAQLANASTAANAVLQEQAVIMSEVGADVSNINLQYDEFTGTMAQNIRVQYENVAAIEANKEAQKLLLAAIKEQGFATDQQVAQLSLLKEESALLANTNKDLTATIRLQAQAFNAEEGSITALAANLELLQREYAKLGTAEQGSAFGQRIKAEIDLLDPAVKKAEEGIGKTGKQVGSYAASIGKALGGAFSYVRQLAYILPGIGIAGILSAAIQPAVELAKALFEDADAARELAVELDKLSREAADAKKDVADLADDLKYVQQLGKINIQIDTINSPEADKMKGTLMDLRALSIEAGKQIDQLNNDKIPKVQAAANQAYQEFISQLSDKVGILPNSQSERSVFEQANGVESLFYNKLSEKSKAAYDTYKKLNESLDELNKGAIDKTRERNIIYRQIEFQKLDIAKEEATQERNLRLANANALSEIEKTKADRILNSDRSSQQQRLSGLRQYLNAEIIAINAQNRSVQDNPESSPQEKAASLAKANSAIFAARQSYEQKVYQLNEEYRLKNAKANADYQQSLLKDDEEFQKKLIDNTIGSIETRKEALATYNQDQLNLVKNNFELQLQQAGFSKRQADEFIETGKYQIEGKKITNAELIQLQRAYESEVLGIIRSTEEETTKIVKDEIEKQTKLRQESIDRIETAYSNRSLGTFSTYVDEIAALNSANAKKLMSEDQYQKQRRQIEVRYQKNSLTDLIDELEEELTVYDGSNQKLIAAQLKLNNDRERLRKLEAGKHNEALIERLEREIEVDQLEVDSFSEAVKKKIELLEKLKKAQQDYSDTSNQDNTDTGKEKNQTSLDILESAGQGAQELTNLSDAIHDKKIQQLENEKKALEDRYNTEVEYINRVYANSVDKQQKLDDANKRYAASKAQLDAKEREEQLRKARFDKANSIFQIIIGTAAAIIRDLGNPLKIAFDATMGAIQLAIASAAPLPAYKSGTKSSVGGRALVAEEGRELGIEPSGRVILWEKPTITNLIAGTRIYPNRVTEDMLRANSKAITSFNPKVEVFTQGHDQEILQELKEMNRRPPIMINVDYNLTTTSYYQNQIKR